MRVSFDRSSIPPTLPLNSIAYFVLYNFVSKKKDVYDDVEYLSSLGKAQTANVKRDAAVGVAQANRDAGIRVRIAIKHSIF